MKGDEGVETRWRKRAGWIFLGASLLWVLVMSRPGWMPGFKGSGGLLSGGARFGVEGGAATSPEDRRPMPPISFERIDGGVWRMTDYRGKVVLINLWATWCGPCLEEMPGMVRLAERDGPRGLAVVGVAMDGVGGAGNQEKVRAFAERLKVNYPVVVPAAMSQMESGLEGLPTTILVDRAGRVFRTYVGAVEEPGFDEDVERLLRER